jgi:serine/threonine protein kinase
MTPYCSRGDLCNALELSETQKCDLILGIAEAVKDFHAGGFVNDDIKLDNIVLDADGRVYLTDFESAWNSAEPPAAVWGTPGYNAPEKSKAPETRGKASDLFSVGVVFFMIYERLGLDVLALLEKGKELPFSSTPQELRPLIKQLLSLNPEDRGTAIEMLGKIKEFCQQSKSGSK